MEAAINTFHISNAILSAVVCLQRASLLWCHRHSAGWNGVIFDFSNSEAGLFTQCKEFPANIKL